ncbi:hypothetical protein C1C98_03185 [Pseudomonas ogarae]|uniref:Uncharacterized protein n=1 Tax=Pseudomonas ogarae (strain DSM 112162 / CECT 30235 / F113) TaxID=1114970 RepID=A0ABM6QTF2_PSEO1|nr:hypothetical protein C1C98_03185 [Pseudomonas ogarae]
MRRLYVAVSQGLRIVVHNCHRQPKSPCGSGLAREGGVSVDINMSDPPLSRASPLPQRDSGVLQR